MSDICCDDNSLMTEAISHVALCELCHRKYIKGQSENGCPYCEIGRLKEDAETLRYGIICR